MATESELVEKIAKVKAAQVVYDGFVQAMKDYCDEMGERFTDTRYLRGYQADIKKHLTKLRLELMEVRGE